MSTGTGRSLAAEELAIEALTEGLLCSWRSCSHCPLTHAAPDGRPTGCCCAWSLFLGPLSFLIKRKGAGLGELLRSVAAGEREVR